MHDTMRLATVFLALWGLAPRAHAQTSRPSAPDIEFAPPCVRTGEAVACWGPNGGGRSLARVPELDGVTGLVTVGDDVCGTRDGDVACLPARRSGPSRARLLSHDGHLGCTLESSGDVRCTDGVRAHPRGRVLSVLGQEVSCNGLAMTRAIVLHGDGRISAEDCHEPWHEPLRQIAQMEGVDGLFCTRTRAGAIACSQLRGTSHLDATVLASFDGRTGYTDLAVNGETVCALDAGGVVSCAAPGQALRVLPHTGVRAIAFHGHHLCVLDDAGVLCDGLHGMLGVAFEVVGLPPVRSAALSTVPATGCAIDRSDALYCWDAASAPTHVRAGVIAMEFEEGVRFTLDATGSLVVEGARGRGVATLPAFWPAAPREVALSIQSPVVCAAAAAEVRCAEVRMRGSRPEAVLPIDTVTDDHRALTRRREPASELDGDGSWWFHDTRWGRDQRFHLRDDIVWTTRSRAHETHGGIDRDGRLWVTTSELDVAGTTYRTGTWTRIPIP